ncbi:MAG: hypothetical protein GWN00_11295, partial [Aliifodinibius sp.]|nr:hypothetical protein [Fodinibius sp.]NIY25368.1 hypothetical protein [Fodinibius sp.]
MSGTWKSIIILVFVGSFIFGNSSLAQQNINLDWKVHDVGKARQLITNVGALWAASTDYPGLIYCEFPPNSSEEHIGE